MITPVGDVVILKKFKLKEEDGIVVEQDDMRMIAQKSDFSGILVPQNAGDDADIIKNKYEIIAIGEGEYIERFKLKVGEFVYCNAYNSDDFREARQDYKLINAKEIRGKF